MSTSPSVRSGWSSAKRRAMKPPLECANDDGCFESERVHESREIRREIAQDGTPRGTARVAMAPLRQGKGVNGLGQIGEHELEGSPGVQKACRSNTGTPDGSPCST